MNDATRRAQLASSCQLLPGPVAKEIDASVQRAAAAAAGIWRHDPSVWSADKAVQAKIANRLGWLDSPALMRASVDRLRTFADEVRRDGFTDVVLLGMGGSSLAPEVLRAILGTAPGFPRFRMIDSTDPAAVEAAATDPKTTLYILASKSGGTIEPNSLAAHFKSRLETAGVGAWGRHFVAITDEGTALAERAQRESFREIFINPSNIGGRYSALSFFGLVPAALMGQDVESIVGWALAMLEAADPASGAITANPAFAPGLAIAAAVAAGRDKLTLVTPTELEPFGLWVEQLVAESTGKSGVGVVPVTGEPRAAAEMPATDRLVVHLHMGPAKDSGSLRAVQAAGHPAINLHIPEPAALGAEFVRWEIATALAGAMLGINPFDEPNVQQAKDATGALLTQFKASGKLPVSPADKTSAEGVAFTLSHAARAGGTPESFLTLVEPRDYLAILAYLGPAAELMSAVTRFREAAFQRTKAATTFGYGPRYLHSTGQLHKGGPNTGVFVLITAAPIRDVPIPGEPFSFGTLEFAQALGDFASLDREGRRALHIHLPKPDPDLLMRALSSLV